MCDDAVRFRSIGGIGIHDMAWVNRPTWQQVVEVQGHRGRSSDLGGDGNAGGGGSGAAGAGSNGVTGSAASCKTKHGKQRARCICRQRKKGAARRKCKRKKHLVRSHRRN
jgi:hypothetical protein